MGRDGGKARTLLGTAEQRQRRRSTVRLWYGRTATCCSPPVHDQTTKPSTNSTVTRCQLNERTIASQQLIANSRHTSHTYTHTHTHTRARVHTRTHARTQSHHNTHQSHLRFRHGGQNPTNTTPQIAPSSAPKQKELVGTGEHYSLFTDDKISLSDSAKSKTVTPLRQCQQC